MFRLGSLSHVTRLDVLVDQNFYLEQFMTQLPNLIELGLNIITRTGLRYFGFFVSKNYLNYLFNLRKRSGPK